MTSLMAPRCPNELLTGVVAQTHKLVGRSAYKCAVCHNIFEESEFDEIDKSWHSNPKAWEAKHMKKKPNKDK